MGMGRDALHNGKKKKGLLLLNCTTTQPTPLDLRPPACSKRPPTHLRSHLSSPIGAPLVPPASVSQSFQSHKGGL